MNALSTFLTADRRPAQTTCVSWLQGEGPVPPTFRGHRPGAAMQPLGLGAVLQGSLSQREAGYSPLASLSLRKGRFRGCWPSPPTPALEHPRGGTCYGHFRKGSTASSSRLPLGPAEQHQSGMGVCAGRRMHAHINTSSFSYRAFSCTCLNHDPASDQKIKITNK